MVSLGQTERHKMDTGTRIQKVLSASPSMLRKIDNILDGKDDSKSQPTDATLLTLTQTARMLGLARITIVRMVKDGVLPVIPVRMGSKRIRRSDVMNFINQRWGA